MDKEKVFQIALAYFQQQDLKSLSPAEALEKFEQIFEEMNQKPTDEKKHRRITY